MSFVLRENDASILKGRLDVFPMLDYHSVLSILRTVKQWGVTKEFAGERGHLCGGEG